MSQSEANKTRSDIDILKALINNIEKRMDLSEGDTRILKAELTNAKIRIKQLEKKLNDAGLD